MDVHSAPYHPPYRGGGGAVRLLPLSVISVVAVAAALASATSMAAAQTSPAPVVASQNPSPMVESTRAHERLTKRDWGGMRPSLAGPAGKPVELWMPDDIRSRTT